MNEYEADLAYTHLAGFSELGLTGANRVVAELRRRRVLDGTVAEVGCGPGVTARRFLRAGYEVLGIDASRDMLALARAEAPQATFRHGTFADAELPPACAAVTAFGEVVNYDVSPDAEEHIAIFLARARAVLHPSGILALDVAGPDRIPGGGPMRHWEEGRDWAVLVETTEDRAAGALTRRMTVFRREGSATRGGWRRTEAEHRQLLYPASRIAALLRDAGFRARTLRSYEPGAEPLAPNHRCFLARPR